MFVNKSLLCISLPVIGTVIGFYIDKQTQTKTEDPVGFPSLPFTIGGFTLGCVSGIIIAIV